MKERSQFRKWIKRLASLRLAVFVILAMAIISAIGTITEARFNDSEMATKLVYQSPWMYAVFALLIVNLTAVMVDRWPWRQHHAGFVLAHIGIITLLFGAWLTHEYGVDGNMVFAIGESRRVVTVKDRDIVVFASLDGSDDLRSLYAQPTDFIRRPPSKERPFVVGLAAGDLRFTEFLPFAFRESETLPTENENDGPAVRFQLENPRVNMTQWLRYDVGKIGSELDLGPAKVVLAHTEQKPSGRNEIILVVTPGSDTLAYWIYNKDMSLRKKGQIKQSETIETDWMGLKFRLLRFLPHAIENVRYVPMSYSTNVTTAAVKFEAGGREYWAGLDGPVSVRLGEKVYVVVYAHRQIPLSFPLRLLKFNMGKYQGTQRASSYESVVEVPDRGTVLISMNEPLKHGGYTFYQSSYEQNEKGEPTYSILSVNYDPGRWIKYLGSLLIVLGAIILFYFKRVQWVHKRSEA